MVISPATTRIIFDIHGVLSRPVYSKVIAIFLKSSCKYTLILYAFNVRLLYAIFILWRKHAVAQTYFNYVRANYPSLTSCIPTIIAMANAQEPNHAVLALVHRLKELGYELHILSNIDEEIFKDLRSRHPAMFTDFDTIQGTNGSTGYGKPCLYIYEQYLRNFNKSGKQLIFIDNKQANIHAAEQVGMIGILFRNGTQLKKDLQNLGINL